MPIMEDADYGHRLAHVDPLDGFVAGPDKNLENPLGKRGREVHGRSSKPWPDPLRRP